MQNQFICECQYEIWMVRVQSHPQIQIVTPVSDLIITQNSFKVVNKLFPISSGGDKAHTNLDVASLIYQTVKDKPELIPQLNKALEIALSATRTLWVTACSS
ncbi:Hypothetical protein FKW44_013330 [Caligus rogercresseyi]|uniref:Uncharacterized protein n=1 Tax=Caligus rogercresseyi TaxID=217165 RepID=A0A7T8HKR2_CALRO|nr:Hypothetical protein FKW44_013330 [Caligus rogercresseyi]